MAPVTRYSAGCETALQFVLSLNLVRAGIDETRSDLISRFIEFWCQRNCRGDWGLHETNVQLRVWFDLPRDVVLFKISEEYGYIAGNKTPVVFQDNSRPTYLNFGLPNFVC